MRTLAALALTGLLLLPGCGAQGGPESDSPDLATETRAPVGPIESSGPYGTLGPEGVGRISIGATTEEVEAAFGKPDDTQEVSFAGPDTPAPQVDWVWHQPGGEFRLQFQTSDNTVTGYRTFSPDLTTEEGIGVGDTLADVKKTYGDVLRPGAIGEGTLLLSKGTPGSYPGITFAAEDKSGEISAIEGGLLQPAGD